MCRNLYINFSKCSEVENEKVTIDDVAKVWCKDSAVLAGVKNTVISHMKGNTDEVKTFNVISVCKILEQNFPDININNMGATEFMVVYHYKKKENKVWQIIKMILICIIVFFGGAFAIMAYGNDIDIGNLFKSITKDVTGNEEDNIILEVAYSIGLSAGIIIFFNNFGKRKSIKDPTPIQVSMRSYEEELYKTIVENDTREGNCKDD